MVHKKGAGHYNEPRIQDRSKLLLESYKSAVLQAKKARIYSPNHFFFLEDTSVIIHALSNDDQEIPGVDIKYWMNKTNFENIDTTLKSLENDRRVSVRSDIVLHIPEDIARTKGITSPYLIFTGIQHGKITNREYSFDSNLLYPWLDNISFNKWFIPEGAETVLGKQDIENADKYDFRRLAFEKMIVFLKSIGLLTHKSIQRKLPLETPIVVAGYSCAGKTEASQYLAEKHNFLHVEASDFMYLSYYIRHGYQGQVSIGDFAEQALKDKPHIVAEKILEYLDDFVGVPVIISGFRAPEEIRWLEKRLSTPKLNLETIFIEASQDERFKRLIKRGRTGDNIDFEKFDKRDKQQSRMGLDEIKSHKKTSTIINNESLTKYYHNLREILDLAPPHTQNPEFELQSIQFDNSFVKLENAILVSLLSVWVKSEGGDYFTTNQIAGLIKKVFPNNFPQKHKDNISRYFNQDFHPYYEIDGSKTDAKRRYRLSNTGYGKALTLLKETI